LREPLCTTSHPYRCHTTIQLSPTAPRTPIHRKHLASDPRGQAGNEKHHGLGTTSIREALFQLERQGYVTRVLNKGAYVTELSPEGRRQIYTVSMELEGLSANWRPKNGRI